MLLQLPPTLHYPITITDLLLQPDDAVKRFDPLFAYIYKTRVSEGDDLGNERLVERTFPTRFESSVEGVLKGWRIKRGDVVVDSSVDIVEIEEPCSHSIQFGGMCANCGKDMTETSYITEQSDANRATINMVHNNISLTISEAEAHRAEDESKRRLLAAKRLSLVVDLDQTIIHATVDPTVGDWQRDEQNPNHEAVKDVKSFLLKDDGPGNRGCWYYVKLRPGLQKFLEDISKLYELHIYTMGTRQYAKHIADIVDPGHKFFGERILSRDESGSMTAKDLHRLFPVDTKMVVIIDDRGDVWKWSPNLVKVTPYDFFVGIGDINSSFLPKKPDIKSNPKATITSAPNVDDSPTNNQSTVTTETVTTTATSASKDGDPAEGDVTSEETATSIEALVDFDASPLDRIVAMGGNDDLATRQAETSSQETINAQLEDRPLLQKQMQLEADDAAADAILRESNNGAAPTSSEDSSQSERPKHNLLQDLDRELEHLEKSLRLVHTAFFDAYAQDLAAAQGGRLGQLRGTQKRKVSHENSDLDLVPDIKKIMPAVKTKVFANCVLVLSGMVPLGMDIYSTDLALQASTFGARIEEDVTKATTHIVAARSRTQKVKTAIRKGKGRIRIVSPQWLYDSINSWVKMDEQPYLLDVEEPGSEPLKIEDDVWSESESLADDGSEATDTDSLDTLKDRSSRFRSSSKALPDIDSDLESITPLPDFEYDDKSPVGGSNEDWDAMNDELKDFLGSEADDDDDDDENGENDNVSNASFASGLSRQLGSRGKKRSRDENGTEAGGLFAPDGDDQRKSKKKQNQSHVTSVQEDTDVKKNGTISGDLVKNGHANACHDGDVLFDQRNPDNSDHDDLDTKEGDGWSDFGDEDLEAELEKAMSDGQEETSDPVTSPR